MKKILVLASTFPRWTNDTTPPFVLELEKRLAKDFEIHVLAPHHKGAKKLEKMEGLTVHRFQYFWPASKQGLCYGGGILPNLKRNKLLYFQAITLLFFEFWAAAKIIRAEKIDLIHAHWIIPQGIIAYKLHKLFKTPYIVTTHGGDIYGLQNKFFVSLKKAILHNAKAITVVSTAIRDEIYKKVNSDLKIEVISMGVDTKLFSPDKYDISIKKKYNMKGPFLLFVGRLAEKKGIKYLLEAMPAVLDKYPKTILIIIGEGTLMAELVQLAKLLKIDNNVIFTGPVKNAELPNYYATADVVVCPSIKTIDGDREGLPVVALESLSSGSMLVASESGGYLDIISTSKNGILVKEKDPKALSVAILSVITHGNSKSKIRNSVLKFDWKIISRNYHQLMQ